MPHFSENGPIGQKLQEVELDYLVHSEAAARSVAAGYRVYPCKDGRVTVAALEPHFAASLCQAAGVVASDLCAMFAPAIHEAIAAFFRTQTRQQLDRLAHERNIPMHTPP